MRTQVVENLVNTIEKIAEDTGLSEDEYLLALAISMATLMKRKGSNLMDIDINELTLSEAGASVH
ncbi:hypothetical protein [Rahnella bonaserana]|jgi:hypothetical protein|uniref:Uncharacterized protein n=1 Tax=Rahnella bonaserana TaxID=2816248 RepID=A0ABS6LZN0_9GAMM|nr:hypothetical protein [Rahnella bonaserana]MBU9857466.1 hypothetical protein [Rahnella bonaserana]MCL9642229.1 hypothetical protein [Rahnella victoriana]WHZ41945.1 hypothetical protein QNM34_06620 [Rahnella bonaserana]